MEPVAALLVARYRRAVSLRPALLRARPWYLAEGERIRAMAAELGIDGRRATDAAAALSPAGRWDDVVVRLPAFLRAHRDGAELPPMPTYSRNVRAARAILDGHGAPSGPKVSRFARNLAGDDSCVTVDRWAARAAGMPESGGARWYRAIEGAYLAGARTVALRPSTFQAVLWVALRDGVIPWGSEIVPTSRPSPG